MNEYSNNSLKHTWRDVLDIEMLNYVPDYWLSFQPPDKYQHIVVGVLYIIILIPALCGNGAILFLFFRCRGLRTPSNVLVVNLAASDFLMNIKMPVFIYNSFMYGPALGELGCRIYGFLGGLSGTSAIMTIAFMAFERFISISRPLSTRFQNTHMKSILIVSLIWFYSFIFAFPPVIHLFNRYVPEGYLTSCTFDYLSKDRESQIFIVVYFIAAWVVPMFVIVFSYIGIIVAVKRSNVMFNEYFGKRAIRKKRLCRKQNSRESYKSNKNVELRLAKISFFLVFVWLLSWTPYAIIALIGLYSGKFLSPTVSMIPALFAKTSSVINPFVYGLTHPKFQKEIHKLFSKPEANKSSELRKTFDASRAIELHEYTSVKSNIEL